MKYKEIYRWKELTRLRQKLIHIITSRNIQLHHIRSRVRGYKNSSRLINQLTNKWGQLDTVVKAYNKAAEKLRGTGSGGAGSGGASDEWPPTITLKDLKEKGVTSEFLWYLSYPSLERSPAKEDWAIFLEVREAIDSILKQRRAREEIHRTPLEARRMVQWLETQVTTLATSTVPVIENNPRPSGTFVLNSL